MALPFIFASGDKGMTVTKRSVRTFARTAEQEWPAVIDRPGALMRLAIFKRDSG
jgi:hypothetical protein